MKILEMKILEQMKNILWFYYIFDITSFYKGVACKIYICSDISKVTKWATQKKKLNKKLLSYRNLAFDPGLKFVSIEILHKLNFQNFSTYMFCIAR